MSFHSPRSNRERSVHSPTSRVALLAVMAGMADLHDTAKKPTPAGILAPVTLSSGQQVETISPLEQQRRNVLEEARRERAAKRPWLGRLRIKMWFLEQVASGHPQLDEAQVLQQYQNHLHQIARAFGRNRTPEHIHAVLRRKFGSYPYLRQGNFSNLVTLIRTHTASCKGTSDLFSALLIDSDIPGVGLRILPGDPHDPLVRGHEETTMRYMDGQMVTEFDIAGGGIVGAEDQNSIYVPEYEILGLYEQNGAFEPQYPAAPENYHPRRRSSPMIAGSIIAHDFVRAVRPDNLLPSVTQTRPNTRSEPVRLGPDLPASETPEHRYDHRGAGVLFDLLDDFYFRKKIVMDAAFSEAHPHTPALSPVDLSRLSTAIEEVENYLYIMQQHAMETIHRREISPFLYRQICSLLYLGYQMMAESLVSSGDNGGAGSAQSSRDYYREQLRGTRMSAHEAVTNEFNARIMYELFPNTHELAVRTLERDARGINERGEIIVELPLNDEDGNVRREERHLKLMPCAESIVSLLQTATDPAIRQRIIDVIRLWSEKDVLMKHLLLHTMIRQAANGHEENLIGNDPLTQAARAYREVRSSVQNLAMGVRSRQYTLGVQVADDTTALESALTAIVAGASDGARPVLTREFMVEAFLVEALAYVRITNEAELRDSYGNYLFNPPPAIWQRHDARQLTALTNITNALRAAGYFQPAARHYLDERLGFYERYQNALPIN